MAVRNRFISVTEFATSKWGCADNNSHFIQAFNSTWPHPYPAFLVVTEKTKPGWKSDMLDLVKRPVFMATCISFLLVSLVRGACTDWGQLYLIQDHHHSHLTGGLGHMELAQWLSVHHYKNRWGQQNTQKLKKKGILMKQYQTLAV